MQNDRLLNFLRRLCSATTTDHSRSTTFIWTDHPTYFYWLEHECFWVSTHITIIGNDHFLFIYVWGSTMQNVKPCLLLDSKIIYQGWMTNKILPKYPVSIIYMYRLLSESCHVSKTMICSMLLGGLKLNGGNSVCFFMSHTAPVFFCFSQLASWARQFKF